MKFLSLAALLALATASPCAASTCTLAPLVGDIPHTLTPFKALRGFSTPEACNEQCRLPENAACRAFGVRPSSGGGSCHLFDTDITASVKIRPSTYTYYVLPAGVRGDVPENVARHYTADISKTKGTYEGCRGFCLGDSRCKGFGYKDGGNCQLYDVSLAGKVKAKPNGLYIQYQADCKPASA